MIGKDVTLSSISHTYSTTHSRNSYGKGSYYLLGVGVVTLLLTILFSNLFSE